MRSPSPVKHLAIALFQLQLENGIQALMDFSLHLPLLRGTQLARVLSMYRNFQAVAAVHQHQQYPDPHSDAKPQYNYYPTHQLDSPDLLH